MASLISSVPEFVHVWALICFILVFFSALGTQLFKDDRNGIPSDGQYFLTFWQSLWSLYTLLTTANFPDVMMPAYKARRSIVLFFVVFIVLGIFVGLNLVLATIYSSYKRHAAALAESFVVNRKQALINAFSHLDAEGTGFLSCATLELVFEELNGYHSIPFLSQEQQRLILQCLDANDNNTIEVDEFVQLCEMLATRFEVVGELEYRQKRTQLTGAPLASWLASRSKTAKCLLLLARRATKSRNLNRVLTLVVLCNSLLILAEIVSDNDVAEYNVLELCFSSFYAVEAVMKVAAFGWRNYISYPENIFDCLVAWGILSDIYLVGRGSNTSSFDYYIKLARMVRMLRLFSLVPRFKQLLGTTKRLVSVLATLGALTWVVLHGYAAIGVQAFGGKIRFDSPALNPSPFEEAGYFPNNANDFASAVVTLFELIIVNNWTVIIDGFQRTSSVWAVRLYFVSFWVIVVLGVFNLFVACVLDAWLAQEAKETEAVRRAIERGVAHSEEEEGRDRLSTEDLSDAMDAMGGGGQRQGAVGGRHDGSGKLEDGRDGGGAYAPPSVVHQQLKSSLGGSNKGVRVLARRIVRSESEKYGLATNQDLRFRLAQTLAKIHSKEANTSTSSASPKESAARSEQVPVNVPLLANDKPFNSYGSAE